jgi:DNA-binding NarL/FixJ family response regulator
MQQDGKKPKTSTREAQKKRRKELRLLIADDNQYVRYTMSRLIAASESAHQLEIVGEACTGRDALKLTEELKPDLIIMDAEMPDMNGVKATRQIHDKHPDIKILALSGHNEEGWVCAMLDAGALGFLLKSDMDNFLNALDLVANGISYISPEAATVVIRTRFHRKPASGSESLAALTDEEREILRLICQGYPMKDIADRVHIAEPTAYKRRQHIMQLLGVKTSAGLVNYVHRFGISFDA